MARISFGSDRVIQGEEVQLQIACQIRHSTQKSHHHMIQIREATRVRDVPIKCTRTLLV